MDPALWEILKQKGGRETEIEAIIRLDSPLAQIPGVRIITRFGMIATCRLKKHLILPIHEDESVLSMKAPRLVGPEVEMEMGSVGIPIVARSDSRRPQACPATGKHVVLGCLDWGFDFRNRAFRKKDGSTRLLALWDQRGYTPNPANKYGYGTMYDSDQINRALRSENPYDALGYHPADADRGSGSHGTHVMDIAAGNGGGNGPIGIAPEADLIFVHLTNRNTNGLASLGDSSRILEGIEFLISAAGQKPWVINLSVGRHGGPHNGTTLCEIAFDSILQNSSKGFIVQSAGNYLNKKIHASGKLRQGEEQTLRVIVRRNDTSPNELEIWTKDVLSIVIASPSGVQSARVHLKEQADIVERGTVVGRIYSRAFDPNNGDNHIDIFLYNNAPRGEWKVYVCAEKTVDGIFHAWLERDDACSACQSRFADLDTDISCTTGTLAHASLPIVVGAYNHHRKSRPVAPFSSVGPTRDGRHKPDLVAPGVAVIAARSSGRKGSRTHRLIRKSGTSMAAPHVAGTVALCMEAAGRPLTVDEIRSLILENVDKSESSPRYGRGYLNILESVNAAIKLREQKRLIDDDHHTPNSLIMNLDILKTLIAKSAGKFDSGRSIMNEILKYANSGSPITDPERIYRTAISRNKVAFPKLFGPNLMVIGRPEEPLQAPPRQGDVLVRVALGEPGLASVSVLSDSRLIASTDLQTDGMLETESQQPGSYALVLDGTTFQRARRGSFARRLLDGQDNLLPGQVLLRPSIVEDPSDDLEGQLVDEEPLIDEQVAPARLQDITHAGTYRLAYDRLGRLGVIEGLPGRNTRRFRGTAALQSALDRWASNIEKVLKPPLYILTGGLHVNKPGEHGSGNAIDVDGFWWSDAEVFLANDAQHDWYKYLTVEATLRKVFGTVLNYDYNAAHHDHWHCDLGADVRWRAVRSQALFAQRALNVIWGENLAVDGRWGKLSAQAATRNGYDFTGPAGWDRFLDSMIERKSIPATEDYVKNTFHTELFGDGEDDLKKKPALSGMRGSMKIP